MASRVVTRKSLCMINSTLKNSNTSTKTYLSSVANNQSLVLHSLKITDTSVIRPTAKCRPPVLPCPPPHYACPPPDRPYTRRLLQALWFLFKLALFLSITQMTIDEGLWGSAEESEDLAKRVGMISTNEDEEKSQAESKEDQQKKKSSFKSVWNDFVLTAGKIFGLKP